MFVVQHPGSDHCPAMKGIETNANTDPRVVGISGSDHCPAMKGIETTLPPIIGKLLAPLKRPLPRNEGD